MRLTVALSGTSAIWSVDAQPSWNVHFLRQLACQHFGLPAAGAVLTVADAPSPLDDFATLSDCAGLGEDSRLELRAEAALGSPRGTPGFRAANVWIFCYDCEAARPAASVATAACAECGRPHLLPVNAAAEAAAGAGGDCAGCGRRGVRFRLELACSREGPHPTRRCVLIRELVDLPDAGHPGCSVCLSCPASNQPLVAFPCGHAACLGCFAADASVRLQDARLPYLPDRGLTVECPAFDCRSPSRYLTDAHAFRLLGAEAYERVKLLGAQRALTGTAAGWVTCPMCAAQYELPETAGAAGTRTVGDEVTCERALGGCGARICLACRALGHSGPCASAPGAGADANAAQLSVATIQRTAKPCPRCRAPTERNGGCMHMTCRVCGLGWCWLCQLEWSSACQTGHWFG